MINKEKIKKLDDKALVKLRNKVMALFIVLIISFSMVYEMELMSKIDFPDGIPVDPVISFIGFAAAFVIIYLFLLLNVIKKELGQRDR